jgi:hypothetical protein
MPDVKKLATRYDKVLTEHTLLSMPALTLEEQEFLNAALENQVYAHRTMETGQAAGIAHSIIRKLSQSGIL